jgi:hypothetical protein
MARKNMAPLPPKKPTRVYLYSQSTPNGRAFLTSEVEKMRESGWVDSPAKLDLPKEEKVINPEQVEQMRPDELVNMVKTMGYKVLTDLEFTAEINKAVSKIKPVTIDSFSNDELIAEAESRGLKDSEEESLADRFMEKPKSLTKEELVRFGNTEFKLGLRVGMLEDTLIEKIQEAMKTA